MGILVGLALKAGLDAAYSDATKSPGLTSFGAFWQIIWSTPLIQVVIFLLTLIRFIYGAHRILETVEESSPTLEWWANLWNILGMVMLFVFFYMTGLCVLHPIAFYSGLIAVHVWDFLWFLRFTSSSDALGKELKYVMRRFMWIDFLTVAILTVLVWPLRDWAVAGGAIVMVLLAVVDAIWNYKFLFRRDCMRTD